LSEPDTESIFDLLEKILIRLRRLEKFCHWHEPRLTKPVSKYELFADDALRSLIKIRDNQEAEDIIEELEKKEKM